MEPTFRAFLKQRHDFESWQNTTTLDREIHITEFSFTGQEFPRWQLLRVDLSDSAAGPLHQSIWQRSEGELLSVNVLECASRAVAHEAIIEFLGEFESPLIARQAAGAPGDIAFAMPGDTAVLFARGNLVVLLRNAGPRMVEIGTLAHSFDQSLMRLE